MEPENTTEDWPHLDGSLKSILANRKSPSDLSRTKYKGLLFSLPTNSELKIPREAWYEYIVHTIHTTFN